MATKFNASVPMLSRTEIADVMCTEYGTKRSLVVEGPTGIGKTQLARDIAERLGFTFVYFDCQTKGLEDLTCPKFVTINGMELVASVPHEEFGLQYDKPIVLLIDEFAKNRSLQGPMARVLYEREIGSVKLHPQSRIIATGNLSAENFGDVTPGYIRSRVAVVTLRNTAMEELLQYGQAKGWDTSLLATIHENPALIDCFVDVEKCEDNPYINDPRDPSRKQFSCPRSLENLSDLLHERKHLNDDVVLNMAMGIVGSAAAKLIMTFVTLSDTLPKYDVLVLDPKGVKVPDSAGGRIISALTCLQRVQANDFPAVFAYIKRLPMEVQALFANQLMKTPTKAVWVSRQADFTEFARKNFALFTQ